MVAKNLACSLGRAAPFWQLPRTWEVGAWERGRMGRWGDVQCARGGGREGVGTSQTMTCCLVS